MSDVKQVKVDNWGIYFLQRLKHFFNRTDYCDLTLQFQDNAQLKVHRLVLSACTEYFELLERTCEMYEDCLVMPDDLQADVVVPIINFMYTGQLEFKMDLLEKLYQTSLIMNMPVLTKLLASHHSQSTQQSRTTPSNYYGKRYAKHSKTTPSPSSSATNKRSFSNAFENTEVPKPKKTNVLNKIESQAKNGNQDSGRSSPKFPVFSEKNKTFAKEPRPTRYELPAELDEDNIFDNSFTNISYTSKPLMVHPETTKQYTPKKFKLFEEGTSSRYARSSSNADIVECKKISSNNSLFIDEPSESVTDENDMYQQSLQSKDDPKDTNQLFDQIIENDCSNITIETKNSKQSGNLDHAKIISEVLKKYPHLVKSNKHIKLKILNSHCKSKKSRTPMINEEKESKMKAEAPDFTYETDVLDSKEAARLIALGAENIKGPWICLICGTPGKALHFTSYYNFRKHLVEIHNEKAVPNICEYCGLKSQKRNYLVHHQLTKHGVTPPSHYNFPKCNYCKYIALNEALLVKHKMTHTEVRSFRRNSFFTTAFTSSNVVDHTQKTGNKYVAERKQCNYCLRNFLRDANLYAHLKTNHKEAAKNDGLIDDSDEEIQEEEDKPKPKLNAAETSNYIKVEVPIHFDNSYDDSNVQYQIERRPDGNIHVVSKKPRVIMPVAKHKILNPGFTTQLQSSPTLTKPQKAKTNLNTTIKRNEYLQEMCVSPPSNPNNEEIVLIDNTEYIIQDYQLIPKKEKFLGEYLMTNTLTTNKDESVQTGTPTTSLEFHNIHNSNQDAKMFLKKSTKANQPIQIVVSNEEEYKALVSNQSVIFEDADTNKSLAVLAQESSSLETATIDLDSTQSNDMMIIQDNYSINVSEAVANNSNIVVVYSHPVEDQNKQYQIITTQEVEAQFVPSSPIITQNYETVTTCSPIVTHTTVDNSWQNNIQTHISKLPMTSTSELHTMTVAESVTIAPESESNNNVNEFQDVPMLTPEAVPVINMDQIVESHIQTTDNNFNESNIITNITEVINNTPVCHQSSTIAIEQPTVITSHQQGISENHMQPLSEPSLDQPIVINTLIPTPSMSTEEQSIETTTLNTLPEIVEEIPPNQNAVYVEEMLQQPINSTNPLPVVDNQSVIKSLIGANTCAESSESIITDVEAISHQSQDDLITESVHNNQSVDVAPDAAEEPEELKQPINEIERNETIEITAGNISVNQNIIEVGPELPRFIENTEVDPVSKVAIAQIENLTSEWSEDESETVPQEGPKTDKVDSEAKSDDAEESSEVEESIENIQQEMRKHVSVELLPYTKEDNINSSKDNLSVLNQPQESTEISVQTSQEKISSLLNDWDDNDSQEDVPATNETKVNDNDESKSHNENLNEERESVLVDKVVLMKNDKIKSLVSDWDEDEEETKG